MTHVMDLMRRGIITVSLLLIALLLSLALISYTANDPSWSNLSSNTNEVKNLVGVFGAWSADILYVFLGLASWWLVAAITYEAYLQWKIDVKPNLYARIAGYIFLMIGSSSLFILLLPSSWGKQGIIGHVLGRGLSSLISIWLAVPFLLIFVAITITFVFDIHWQKLRQYAIHSYQQIQGKLQNKANKSIIDKKKIPVEKQTTQVKQVEELNQKETLDNVDFTQQHTPVTSKIREDYQHLQPHRQSMLDEIRQLPSSSHITKALDSRLYAEVIYPETIQTPVQADIELNFNTSEPTVSIQNLIKENRQLEKKQSNKSPSNTAYQNKSQTKLNTTTEEYRKE